MARLGFDPLGDGISRVDYDDHMGGDAKVVRAARVSFSNDTLVPSTLAGVPLSESELAELEEPTPEIIAFLSERPDSPFDVEKDTKLIRYLIKNKHWSPLEHTVLTYMIKCPLFIARQWHRHWTWSYNEVSRRYTSEDIQFYYPNEWRLQSSSNRQASEGTIDRSQSWRHDEAYSEAIRATVLVYEWLNKEEVSREMARMVLPQSMYTRFYGTVNLRSVMHFCAIRDDAHAQWEIQKYAQAVAQIARMIAPVSMKAYDDFVKGDK